MKNSIRSTVAFVFLFIMVFGLVAQTSARADVIWEPENSFYRRHADECDYVNRYYYSNGLNGYMEIFTEPGGRNLGFAENGYLFYVQVSYELGTESWGYVEFYTDEGLLPKGQESIEAGWVRLEEMLLKFDAYSFDGQHAGEYKAYEGDYTEFSELETIVLWSFPNSGEVLNVFENFDGADFSIRHVYTDLEGQRWGNFSYFYGWRNVWICLDRPADTSLGARDVPSPEFYTPEPGYVPQSGQSELTTGIILAVAAVVLLSALLLALRKKRLRNSA